MIVDGVMGTMSEAHPRFRATRSSMSRRATALGSLFALVASHPAYAHTLSQEPTIFNDDNGSQCIKQKRAIWEQGATANNVSVSTTTSSKKKDFFVNCLLAKSRGKNKLAAWVALYYGPSSFGTATSGPYNVCWTMAWNTWAYNQSTTASMRIEANFGNLPCGGNRWYRVGSRSKWYYDGGRVGNKYYGPGYWEEIDAHFGPAHQFTAGAK